MSADKWTVCPACTKRKESSPSLYGKVSEEEYLAVVTKEKDEGSQTNMREDYEIGIDSNGEFSVNYRCYCEECKFQWKYKIKQIIPLPK